MSKLEELIEELCPDGVEYRTLDKCCDVSKGEQLNKDLLSKELSDDKPYAVINGGKNPSGYWHMSNQNADTITISQGGASAGFVDYQIKPFWAGAHCYVLSNCKDDVVYKYLYYNVKQAERILTESQYGGGIPALAKKDVEALEIPIPPLPVQEEIVRILDNFTDLTAELQAELQARAKQYEYYRNELLTFGDDVERIPLSKCVVKTSKIKWKDEDGEYQYIDLSSVDRDTHTIIETTTITSENAPSRAQQIVKEDDVLFGGTRPMLKRSCIVSDKYDNQICSTGFCVLRADKSKALSKWIYYMISTKDFYNHVETYQKGASYPAISDNDVKRYEIPVPPIEQQKKIVEILDDFEIICNDISEGLPAEIEARQKQYEYYRNKILTFKELG